MIRSEESYLVRKAQSGDTEAMKTLYKQNIEFLTAVCLRYLPEDEDARDVLQESFIKIFNSINRFEYRGEGSVRAYMTRIVINESLQYLKVRNKNRIIEYVDILPDQEEELDDREMSLIPIGELRQMIRRLPYLYRVVFNLHVFSDMSHKEIGETIGVAEGTSSSALCRAKQMLRKMVRNYLTLKRINNE